MDGSYFLLIAFCVLQFVSTDDRRNIRDISDFSEVCKEPPKPKFSKKVSCEKVPPERLECTVKCKKGYVHENGERTKLFSCDAYHGGWEVYPLPDCQKICDPPCENNGKCSSNSHCICTNEYRGETCHYAVSLCNPANLGFDNYVAICNHTSDKSSCILNCPDGMQFTKTPSDIYECSVNGTWTPSWAPACEPVDSIYADEGRNVPLSGISAEAALAPVSSGVCAAWGRYHYRTFDGRIYSFYGPCTYLLAKDCSEDTFSIYISDASECDQEPTLCSRKITIHVGDERYDIGEEYGELIVKYQNENVAIPSIAGTLKIEQVSQYLIITSSLGYSLKWDGKQTVLLSLHDMANKTCGLCGQNDGSVLNDFEMLRTASENGRIADHVIPFVDSWKMPKFGEKCSVHTDYGCSYKSTDEKAIAEAAHTACKVIFDESYNNCHETVNPKKYFDACKAEFCGCKEFDESCICDTLAEYFRECVRLGGKIHGGWRKPDICPLDCPAGMEYTDCGSSCPKTCKRTQYGCDNEHCIDGCHCHTGMLLFNGTCVPEAKCPCSHGDNEFLPGEKITDDCNQCECIGGKWDCTKKECTSRCTSTGDSHYTTFDGYKYQFKGKCSYHLVHHNNFTVIQDNSLCTSSKKSTSCKKSIIVDVGSTNVILKHNMEVTVNGQDINKFPFTNKEINLQKTSSAVVLDVIKGVTLTWDGTSIVFIDAPAFLIGSTQGLCGTFNHNTKDDFTTLDGAIEALVDDFAKKWKTDTECKEQINTLDLDDPCDIYKEKAEDARILCDILKNGVFKGCHPDEDPDPFYRDCLYDLCTCNEEVKNCLCPALTSYAAACTKKGITLPWREEVKECEMECAGGQIYQECGNPCTYSCKSLSVEKCDKTCVEGCACSEGTTLAPDGVCIPISQCPCFHEEKEYPPGSKRQIGGLFSCDCINGRWDCLLSNYENGNEMMAIEAESCDQNKNMVYSECLTCPETCENYFIQPKCDTSVCRFGCSCKKGYLLDTDTSSCVKIENCGCWHGGKRFPEGSSHKRDCNKCTCLNGKWECEYKQCPGICSSWGESHFKTFDGHYFDFQGTCEYILTKGTLDDGRNFQIIIETKICGTSGVTCAKGVKFQLGNDVKLTLFSDTELPKPSYDSPFLVRKVGLLIFVYTKIGVTFYWDKGTRISIRVEPKWKGKLSGLCGDFNDDQADDFRTPASGPIEARPRYFGDSWKLNAACPFPQHINDTCAIHSHRKSWAKKRCSVLKSDLFGPCHKFVPLDPFYQRCVFDTCGCDLGGDCDCFCTALAAYAEECSIYGITIAWRSQDLCPIQCGEYERYEPCMSTCPKETCETKFIYNDIKKGCSNEPCVEGCEPESCPSGQIYNNDRDFKCIPEIECEVPCKEINGRLYVEGEQIKDYTIVDKCQICNCKRGKIVCTGELCRYETFCESTGWSQWMNSPSTPSGDYEYLSNPLLQNIYFKYCTMEHITNIECRVTYSHIPFEHTGQKGICQLPEGLICNDNDQQYGICEEYEIRIFCQCELTSEKTSIFAGETTTTEISSMKIECLAPGWTYWMQVPPYLEGVEFITKLRKYYSFCPEDEIEEVECRVIPGTKDNRFENTKCTKNGIQCIAGLKGTQCPDYEIRFYCRCKETECAYPRGMETGIIGDYEITAKSVFKKGVTEGYHGRLNGKGAWTPSTDSQQQWIQVDLGEIQQITAIMTQGNPVAPLWVEKYRVYHSVDGLAYAKMYANNGDEVIFQGNSDQNTAVLNTFPYPVRARYIRIYPYQWYGAVSLRLELLGCNVHAELSTEIPSTTSVLCVPGWTEFINTDSPDFGDEDFEKIEKIVETFGVCTGGKISDIECKAVINNQLINYNETGDFGVTCKKSVGFYCSNFQQESQRRKCYDYSIRLYCICEKLTTVPPITSISPQCGWTEWLNIDKPKSFKGDKGDMESIEILQKHYKLCQKPHLKYVECRIALTQHDWTVSQQNELRCGTDVGFVCYNHLQAGNCYDYEIRAYCFYDWCEESTPVSAITSTISSTPTGSCLPGQYYDDCAYMCNQTCMGYLNKLHQIGKCQADNNIQPIEDNCIATCRPRKRCDYPLLWKDPDTCVKKSECSCVMTNGNEVQPGEVVYEGCESCSCYDNSLSCTIIPECRSTPSVRNLSIATTTPSPSLCREDMTSINFDIPIEQITVSSQGLLSGKQRIYLNTTPSKHGAGAWSPKVSDENQYVQIGFEAPQYVIGVITQGENGVENWVTKYIVQYSLQEKIWKDVLEGYKTKVFIGNYDSDTPVTHYFQDVIEAQYIRIKPVEWHNWIAMRLGIIGCIPSEVSTRTTSAVLNKTVTTPAPPECLEPMIFPDVEIITSTVSVSSAESEFSGANRLKIDTKGGYEGTGGWKAAINDNNQFVQIDFQEDRNLSAVITQGQEDEDNWVTSYAVKYSIDNVHWIDVSEETTGRVFRGNNNRNTPEFRWFKEIIVARHLRIIPVTIHGAIAMRLEVLGCYTPSERITTKPPTLPPVAFCPELPAASREYCPYCTSGLVCDGRDCVNPEDCPCYMEGRKYRVGSKFETSDCQDCICRMHGKSYCEKMECLFCPDDQKSVLTSDCQCECEGCAEGTVYCPTDQQCIDEYKWCDGKIDCADDEVNCPSTTTTVIFPSTTHKICVPTLNGSVDTCELNSGYFKTFDGSHYEVDICNHILFREKYFYFYSIRAFKECSEANEKCERYIVIMVDDFDIKMGPGLTVVLNDVIIPKNKLYYLSKRFKEFTFSAEGTYLTFTSLKYGFKVLWDSQDNVKIKVSRCLFEEVVGLCGFYDGIKENDFEKPDGSIAQTVESFTNSWIEDHYVSCIQSVCDPYMRLAAKHMCSSIEDSIFDDCNRVLNMKRQKEICVSSACECLAKNFSSADCTCQVLENFLHECEEKIEVVNSAWRVQFSCVPSCPPDLEWNDCGPSCELTCENFQDKNRLCPKKCTPGCFCPPGLVRKEDKCIDAKLCHDCVCLGFGDPNFQTFDHKSYAFQGNCTYVLVQHLKKDEHPNIEVYLTNTECPLEPGTTCATGLKIIHNNNVITIVRYQPVKFNEQVLQNVYNFYQDGINITATKERATVYIAENNFLAQYLAPNYGFSVKLPSKLYYNETTGLCGICNFDSRDDLYHRDGYITEDIDDFAYSWLVDGSRETCKLIAIPPEPPGDLCEFIVGTECNAYVDPAPYIKACRNDVSYSNDKESSKCNALLQYASTCCEYDVVLDEWLQYFGCEVPCSHGLTFQCKSPCQLTCSNYNSDPEACDIQPEYICSCPGNQVFKDGECVDSIYCETCDDEGHRVGEHWNVDLCLSCECLPGLKILCQNTNCPVPPTCPTGTSLQVVANGTCCDQYECILEATTCPPPITPTCPTGARPQLITTDICPEYQCECDLSLCQPLRNISYLEPGEIETTEEDGCCIKQKIICDPDICPKEKLCGIGSKLTETEGKCCTLYSCTLLEKCVYRHRSEELEDFEIDYGETNTKLYEAGETWTDGLCTTCRCDKESEQFIYSCENKECVEPSYITDQIDYIYEEKKILDKCCPDYVRVACQSNGTTYQVGDKWPASYGDRCNSYQCIITVNGEIEKVLNVINCEKDCPAYANYIEPSLESLECCGYCETFGCEDEDKIYNVGETWIPSYNECIHAECVEQNGKIEKILTGKQCPLIPPDCPDEHKTKDESGCCDLCQITPGTCEVIKIPPDQSAHHFFLHDKVNGVCVNKEEIEDLTQCSGHCTSEVTYLSSSNVFETTCKCCIPLESEIRSITLKCDNNAVIVKEYKQPISCGCISCSREESFNYEIKEPKPV